MIRFRFILFFFALSFSAFSQDTLQLEVSQADQLFLKNNLLLLASSYDISAEEALILQAKAYPNPQFSIDLNAIDNQNKRYFHTGATGQKSLALDQLIRIGGKRKAEIELAKGNAELAKLSMKDLLRSLQFQLHCSFFRLKQQQSLVSKYERQLVMLDSLIATYSRQAQLGNVPMKDVVRLKTVYLKLNNDRSEVAMQAAEEMAQLQVMLQTQANILPVIPNDYFEKMQALPSLSDLLQQANSNRPDLTSAQVQTSQAEINLRLQKRNAIPDMHVIGSYDQRGGAFTNQVNLGVGMPLPLWDRNKGNIRSAAAQSERDKTLFTQKQIELVSEVQQAWKMMQLSKMEYAKVNAIYSDDFEKVIQGVNDNFQKKNITILEFVDFFEAYNESQAEMERIRTQLAISAANINYSTATRIY